MCKASFLPDLCKTLEIFIAFNKIKSKFERLKTGKTNAIESAYWDCYYDSIYVIKSTNSKFTMCLVHLGTVINWLMLSVQAQHYRLIISNLVLIAEVELELESEISIITKFKIFKFKDRMEKCSRPSQSLDVKKTSEYLRRISFFKSTIVHLNPSQETQNGKSINIASIPFN